MNYDTFMSIVAWCTTILLVIATISVVILAPLGLYIILSGQTL